MKSNGTILCSLLGGMLIGSAITVFMAHKGAYGKSHAIHEKIMNELEKLRNMCHAQSTSEEMCDCNDPACNCNNQE